MPPKKDQLKEVICFRLLASDIKALQQLTKKTGTDTSTIIRGLTRLGLAVYLKESQTNESEALLRVARAGSFNN